MEPLIRNDFEQSLLHYMSKDFLAILQNIHIGIAGAGGLGSNIANMLVRTGVIRYTIADFDKVQMHNLNRQNYYPVQVGDFKASSTMCVMKSINKNVDVDIYTEKVTSENIKNMFASSDIIFEAFDDASCKKMFFEELYPTGKTIIMGSGISGFSMEGETLNVREIGGRAYIVGFNDKEVDKDNPPFISKVIAIASIMTNMGLNSYIRRFRV